MIKINKKLVSLLLIGLVMSAAAFFVACAEEDDGAGAKAISFKITSPEAAKTAGYLLTGEGAAYTLINDAGKNVVGATDTALTVAAKGTGDAPSYSLLSKVAFTDGDVDLSGADATTVQTALTTYFTADNVSAAVPTANTVIAESTDVAASTIYSTTAVNSAVARIKAVTVSCTSQATVITCGYSTTATPSDTELDGRTAYNVFKVGGTAVVGDIAAADKKTVVKTALHDGAVTPVVIEFHVVEFADADAATAALKTLAEDIVAAGADGPARLAVLNAYGAKVGATKVTLTVTADLSSLD